MAMERTRIDAGAVSFSIGYYSRDGGVAHGTAPGARGGQNPDQGVSLQVRGEVDGVDTELLRFDCFEIAPHYHYAPRARTPRSCSTRGHRQPHRLGL